MTGGILVVRQKRIMCKCWHMCAAVFGSKPFSVCVYKSVYASLNMHYLPHYCQSSSTANRNCSPNALTRCGYEWFACKHVRVCIGEIPTYETNIWSCRFSFTLDTYSCLGCLVCCFKYSYFAILHMGAIFFYELIVGELEDFIVHIFSWKARCTPGDGGGSFKNTLL